MELTYLLISSTHFGYSLMRGLILIGVDIQIINIGNSGRYSKTDKNPFNTIVNPLLVTGGLGGLTLTATNEGTN